MICSTLVHVFMPIILIRGAFEQCSVTGTAILTIGRHNRNTAGYMYVPINVALLNIRFTNSQNGSMQYFGKEPWLSTKTGGGGGGGRNTRTEARFAGSPNWRSDSNFMLHHRSNLSNSTGLLQQLG